MKVEFFPAAEQELIEAADDYERRVPGLGDDLILEVERVIGVLIELPSLGEKLDEIHRRIPGLCCTPLRFTMANGLSTRTLNSIQRLVEEHESEIRRAWKTHFGN